MDESETEEEGCNGWSVTENVDPPDMKFGGLGDVVEVTRSQGQICNSPERYTLSIDYTYISFSSLEDDQSWSFHFQFGTNLKRKSMSLHQETFLSFLSFCFWRMTTVLTVEGTKWRPKTLQEYVNGKNCCRKKWPNVSSPLLWTDGYGTMSGKCFRPRTSGYKCWMIRYHRLLSSTKCTESPWGWVQTTTPYWTKPLEVRPNSIQPFGKFRFLEAHPVHVRVEPLVVCLGGCGLTVIGTWTSLL